jgi:hypothetical protein
MQAWSLGVCLASITVAIPLWLVRHDLWSLPFYVTGAIALMVHRIGDSVESVRKRKEIQAGYTTLKNGPADVDHVDARSHRLIRFADEVLAEDVYQFRLKAVRGESGHRNN